MRLMQVISDYIRRSILTTQGDLVVRGAAIPERLAAGAAGTYLMGQGVGVKPAYVAPSTCPALRAKLSANQVIPSGAWTLVQLDSTDFDSCSDFDTVNNKWVCSEDGLYLVSVNVRYIGLPDTTGSGVIIKLNGAWKSPFMYLYVGGAGVPAFGSTDIHLCSVNDEIQMFTIQLSGVNQSVSGGVAYATWMSICRL